MKTGNLRNNINIRKCLSESVNESLLCAFRLPCRSYKKRVQFCIDLKVTIVPGGVGHICLNLDFRQNFP